MNQKDISGVIYGEDNIFIPYAEHLRRLEQSPHAKALEECFKDMAKRFREANLPLGKKLRMLIACYPAIQRCKNHIGYYPLPLVKAIIDSYDETTRFEYLSEHHQDYTYHDLHRALDVLDPFHRDILVTRYFDVKLPSHAYKICRNKIDEFHGIGWLLFHDGGKTLVRDYVNGVEFLAEKIEKGEKHEVNISDLLASGNVELISKSFRNPTFVQWFYKLELPSYSWSARDGEPMMRALKTGDYKMSYDAEMRLIERVQRDIGERYE